MYIACTLHRQVPTKIAIPGSPPSLLQKDLGNETSYTCACMILLVQGQAFLSKPAEVVFKDFEVGKVLHRRLQLTNVSYSVNYCKLLGVSEHLKDFITVNFNPPGSMSAGLTCHMSITFEPKVQVQAEERMCACIHSLIPRPPPFFVLRFVFSIIHRNGRAAKKSGLLCIVLNANRTKNEGGLGMKLQCSLIPRPFMSPTNSLGMRLMTMHLRLLINYIVDLDDGI